MVADYERAGPGRLLRRVDGRWTPVGPTLPPLEDDGLHDALRPGSLTYWHFGLDVEARTGDRLIAREHASELLGRCGSRHPAVERLRRYLLASYDDATWVDQWMNARQVWAARVLEPSTL